MDSAHELESFKFVRRDDPPDIGIEARSPLDRDRYDLARLGKKQVLKRNFGLMSMLGFSCTVMTTWEGIPVLFGGALLNGGPAGWIYGYIVAWLGTLVVFATIAELSSMAPTSAGQYHWTSMLAPPSAQVFLSYITGWLTVLGWQATVASAGYLSASMIQGLLVFNLPDYNLKLWHGTLLLWAVVVCAVFFNTVIVRLLPQVEVLVLILHVLGFFVILIPLVYMAPHGSAREIFTTFLNGGHWSSQGISFFIGMLNMVFAFLGTDGVVHMSEEITNPSQNVPRTLLLSVFLNGALGFGMLIGVMFCVGSFDDALRIETPYPILQVFHAGVGSSAAATAFMCLLIVLAFCSTIAIVATSSRMMWAFSRDRGLPCWQYLSKVDPRSSIPLISIATTVTIACLLALITIGSPVAFSDVLSLTISSLYASYLVSCSILLWRRCTGGIALPSLTHAADTTPINTSGARLVWGSFRIPGLLGIAVNALACIYMVVIIFFSFWPPATPVKPATMNFSVLIFGAAIAFAVAWYFAVARRVYTGPVIELRISGEEEWVKSVDSQTRDRGVTSP